MPSTSRRTPPNTVPTSALIAVGATAVLLNLSCLGPRVASDPAIPPPTNPLARHAWLLDNLPEMPREFRAAWVATVANIDWPSAPGLTTAQQQAEMRALLDRAVTLNLNAIIFQVRPTADAFYDSRFEPWSVYLTGTQGEAPSPYYDPLAFVIEEAHARGLELHTWFNPYRAYHATGQGALAANHISQTRPDLVKQYGELMWLDPGEPDARAHSLQVIMDVVERYDIDGVHLDDYFYPYAIKDADGVDIPFPDTASWARAVAAGEQRSISDWRRANVDTLIEAIYDGVKARKPWVKVGISPFGIWRPGHPEQIEGFDAYEGLFADARKWFREGWVDYLSPQLYWSIEKPAQSYPVLLRWWAEQNVRGRHLWPGLYTSRIFLEGDAWWPPQEILDQVAVTREQLATGTGNIHFSMRALMPREEQMGTLLEATVYDRPALVPPSPWLDGEAPGMPQLSVGGTAGVAAVPGQGAAVHQWLVRYYLRDQWHVATFPGNQTVLAVDWPDAEMVVVTGLSRTDIAGPPAVLSKYVSPSSQVD